MPEPDAQVCVEGLVSNVIVGEVLFIVLALL